jgi:uncharacterized membrane protein
LRVQVSQLVKAPKEKVFEAYVDFDSTPRWSDTTGKVRVVGRSGNAVTLEVEAHTRNGPRTVTREAVLTPPNRVVIESESRSARTKGTVSFESVPGGTLVTSTVEVALKGLRRFVFRPAFGEEAETSARRNLTSFARYVEESGAGPDDNATVTPGGEGGVSV